MYKSIDEFLFVLKRELKGNDRALIQDALSDAEEHIRTALENVMNTKQEVTEEEALSQAIESYGDPSEIAADYKKLDEYLTPMLAPSDKVDMRPWWKKFLLIIADPGAWGATLYMLISIITGIIYSTWVVCGLSISLPLLIFIRSPTCRILPAFCARNCPAGRSNCGSSSGNAYAAKTDVYE